MKNVHFPSVLVRLPPPTHVVESRSAQPWTPQQCQLCPPPEALSTPREQSGTQPGFARRVTVPRGGSVGEGLGRSPEYLALASLHRRLETSSFETGPKFPN